MKAARFYTVGELPKVEEVEVPALGPGEALVRVRSCGVCHTDLHFIDGSLKAGKTPMTLGHEIAGEVAEVGEGVEGLGKGDRVVVYFYVTCGRCRPCRTGWETLCTDLRGHIGFTHDGGYAEYVRAPAANLLPLASLIPYDHGAVLVDAASTAYHAVKSVAGIGIGETVMVNGVGGVGLHAVQFSKMAGARVVAVDVSEEKLKFALNVGADDAVDAREGAVAERVSRLTGGGVDAAFECVGKRESIKNSFTSLRRMGRLIFIGYSADSFTISPRRVVYDGIRIAGSRASSRHELSEVLGMAGRGLIRPIVTGIYPLKEVNDALTMLREGRVLGRLVVHP